MVRHVIFVGVSTGQSSIRRIFPRWRSRFGLGEDVEILGCDLPLHAPPDLYRQVVRRVREDPGTVGAVITSHKMDLFNAAQDLFEELDKPARLLGEVSVIARRQGRLHGWAKDPTTVGHAIDRLPQPAQAATDVLCFGAGGAGHAIAYHFLTRGYPNDGPRQMIFTDRDPERLDSIQALKRKTASPVKLHTILSDDPYTHDRLMAALPDNSLVINATGMGKDLPGSPVTDAGQFPLGGIAWDLNYRGERHFLEQARRQTESRAVHVADGWEYFIYGWAYCLEEVFDRRLSREDLELLAADAQFVRANG